MSNYSTLLVSNRYLQWKEEQDQADAALPGRQEAKAAPLDLTNSNKVTNGKLPSAEVILRNIRTGEFFTINKREARLSKMRRRVFAWANCLKDFVEGNRLYSKIMVGLTEADVDGWRPNHIRAYMAKVKRYLGTDLLASSWCAELQERGAVHYHIMLIVKNGARIPKPDKSGMWIHGSSNVQVVRSVFYLASYLKKAYQKMGEFPKGIRMFSVWIGPGVVSSLALWTMKLSSIPHWLCEQIEKMTDCKGLKWIRNPGGGYWFGGRLFRSPFQFWRLSWGS